MTQPAKNQNWQKRQYDSFGPHFRIESANPELGACGNIAYNLFAISDSKDTSNVGMMGNGQYQIFADQCITIDGGAKVNPGGVCVLIKGSQGDVCINSEPNGDIRINGKNIIIDATQNIELTAGGEVTIDSKELTAATQTDTVIAAKNLDLDGSNIDIGGSTDITLITPKGPIKVKKIIARDVNFVSACLKGTAAAGAVGRFK